MKLRVFDGYMEFILVGCKEIISEEQRDRVHTTSWSVKVAPQTPEWSIRINNQTCASYWIAASASKRSLVRPRQEICVEFTELFISRAYLRFQLWPQSREELECIFEFEPPQSKGWLGLSPEAVLMMTSYTDGDPWSIMCRMARSAIEIDEWTCGDPNDG